jgi:hypothetical protein
MIKMLCLWWLWISNDVMSNPKKHISGQLGGHDPLKLIFFTSIINPNLKWKDWQHKDTKAIIRKTNIWSAKKKNNLAWYIGEKENPKYTSADKTNWTSF